MLSTIRFECPKKFLKKLVKTSCLRLVIFWYNRGASRVAERQAPLKANGQSRGNHDGWTYKDAHQECGREIGCVVRCRRSEAAAKF
jgi:hypothetical protein